MRQVIKHRDIRLLNMIRRTDPVILIMKQNEKNSQKAQELTKEELEQVNGGYMPDIQKGKDMHHW